jgi:hypothetical protein
MRVAHLKRSAVNLKFTDISNFNVALISSLLEKRFEIRVSDRPDFLIYSVSGHEFLKYPDAVRIFFTGENVRPDFNLCDYAFGFDWMEFGDRDYRCPNYALYRHFEDIRVRRRSDLRRRLGQPNQKRFCNFIYTNGHAHPFRDQFFHALSNYKRVDSAGAHLNNIGHAIGPAYKGDWSSPKVELQRQYKFSIAFENSSTPGYTTEKIVHALAADTVPIYWGNPEVHREFNRRRFINCHDFDSVEAIIRRVMEIDQDDSLYEEMLAEPFFSDDVVPHCLTDDAILGRFEQIFGQERSTAFRRNFFVWGEIYERSRREEIDAVKTVERLGTASSVGESKSRM